MTNKQKDIWEKLAKKNSRYYINSDHGKKISEEVFRESGKEAFIQHIFDDELFKNGTILEIGCGTGRMTEFMTWEFDRVIATDISGEMIRQARERLKDCKNIELYETDGETIPIEDNSVDYVFSYLVFQHIKTREMVEKNFKEVYRVLKPGGLFKVLLRTDKQESLEPWWAGVDYNNSSIQTLCDTFGFWRLKTKQVDYYAMWVWLRKEV